VVEREKALGVETGEGKKMRRELNTVFISIYGFKIISRRDIKYIFPLQS